MFVRKHVKLVPFVITVYILLEDLLKKLQSFHVRHVIVAL
jgi:hypothetical protein